VTRAIVGLLTFAVITAVVAGCKDKSRTKPDDPVPTITITTPQNGAIVHAGITVAGTAADAGGNLESVHLRIDNNAWNQAAGAADWQYDWDTTSVSEGRHSIEAYAADATGKNSTIAAVTVTVVANNAGFVTQSAPETMVAGQEYAVYVTMKNTGTTVWTKADGYRLGSQNPHDNVNWGANRIYLSDSDSIAPDDEKQFAFTITAPAAAGTYNFQWQEWWHPARDEFTPTSDHMNSVYQFLDYCEQENITVLAHNWWTGGKYDEFVDWPDDYWWLAACCHDDPANSKNKWALDGWWGTVGPETDHPYDEDMFGQAVVKMADYLVNTKGYTCVKYLGIWNEPNGLWAYNPRDMNGDGQPDFKYPDDFYMLYDKTYLHLCNSGIDGNVALVGCDFTTHLADDPMNDIGNTLSAMSGGHRVDDYIGAISFHSYVNSYKELCRNTRTQIQNNDHDGNLEKILVGEIGQYHADNTTISGKIANSLDCAKKIVGYAREGAYAIARWGYNNLGGGWDATEGYGETIVPQNFNPLKLFAMGLPQGIMHQVMKTEVISASGYFDAVDIQYQQDESGKDTIWLVNDDASSPNRQIIVKFTNLDAKRTFEKWYIDLDDQSCAIKTGGTFTVDPASPQFVDTIPAKCVVVYMSPN
jgi:hypothetical protein